MENQFQLSVSILIVINIYIFCNNIVFTCTAGSKLQAAIAEGPDALEKYIATGEIEELRDVMPPEGREVTRSRITIGKDGSPVIKKSRFSDVIDPKPTFIYGDRYNNAPIIEQPKNFLNTSQEQNNMSNKDYSDNNDKNRRQESLNNDINDDNKSSRFDFDNKMSNPFQQQQQQQGPGNNSRWNSNNQQWQPNQQLNFGPNAKFAPNFRPPNFQNQNNNNNSGGQNLNQSSNNGPPNGNPNNRMMGPPPLGGGNWMRMDFRSRAPFGMNQGPPPRNMMRGGPPPIRGGPRLFGPRPGMQRGRNRF